MSDVDTRVYGQKPSQLSELELSSTTLLAGVGTTYGHAEHEQVLAARYVLRAAPDHAAVLLDVLGLTPLNFSETPS